MINNKQDIWGSKATLYFYLGSVAAMTALTAAVTDLTGVSGNSFMVLLTALVLAAFGSFMLLLELTQKLRFLRVFSEPQSLMTLGAYALVGFMASVFVYAVLFLPYGNLPLYGTARTVMAVIVIVFSIIWAAYPGLELGESRSRTFWNGAGLVPLFLVNGLACGLSVNIFFGQYFLALPLFIVLVLNAIVLAGYVWSANLTGASESRYAVVMLLKGELKSMFVLGAVIIGIILPVMLVMINPVIASALTVIGAGFFRFAFMKAGCRLSLPGENSILYSDSELKHLEEVLTDRWKEKAELLHN